MQSKTLLAIRFGTQEGSHRVVDRVQVTFEVRVGHEEEVACGTGEGSGAIVDPEVFVQEALVVEDHVADVTEVDVDGVVGF